MITGEEDWCIEERSGNKYLTLVSTDKNKEVLSKYAEHWDGIKNLIQKVNNKPGKYGKDFMKFKLNSDDDLSLNKTLMLQNMTIVSRLILQEDVKYYPQDFLDECLYEL